MPNPDRLTLGALYQIVGRVAGRRGAIRVIARYAGLYEVEPGRRRPVFARPEGGPGLVADEGARITPARPDRRRP